MEILKWGKKHSLTLIENGNRLDLILTILKDKGEQSITFHAPPRITLSMILDAWKAQKEQWIEIYNPSKSPFIAKRVIWLPSACILWDVFHIDDVPYDNCGFTTLTEKICPGINWD